MRANHSDIGVTQKENENKGFTEKDLKFKKSSSLGYELQETMVQLTSMHGVINKITSSIKSVPHGQTEKSAIFPS